ncbi:MAG: leucyl/phenylalanyl-tRNA--protein transferase [Rhodobacteraceae bacterium]|nr:leucyl/phenylalanyl-tRNA--protein transferase [Paracoccaceae bacterium]
MGIFPMAEHRDDPEIFWVDPRRRGILPIGGFHISRSLARVMRRGGYQIRFDTDFSGVIDGCADRPETWISEPIRALYLDLFKAGYGHSAEVWIDGVLVGGVYGIALGGAFFGESMFSRSPNASKLALAYLIDRLAIGGFTLFDTQFITDHLATLGAREIPRAEYHDRLAKALELKANFNRQHAVPMAQDVIQRSIQTS